MKEVMSTARSITLSVINDKVHPIVEAVITVSEPAFQFDAGGAVERVRIPETLRFGASPAGLRDLAKHFGQWADEADEVCEKIEAGEIKTYDNDVDQES